VHAVPARYIRFPEGALTI